MGIGLDRDHPISYVMVEVEVSENIKIDRVLEKIRLDWKGKIEMDTETFRKHGHVIVDWIADYMDHIEEYPVLAQVEPGEIADRLPGLPPEEPEEMEAIFEDFKRIILPGMTHWQHPCFFAYFPANSSEPSF